jgi:thiamine biosynthesis lipoprotein
MDHPSTMFHLDPTAPPTRPSPTVRFRPVVATVSLEEPLMAGVVAIYLGGSVADRVQAENDLAETMSGIREQVAALSRFDPASALSALNDDPGPAVTVGPLLGALLAAAREATVLSEGLVDISLLNEYGRVIEPAHGDEGSARGRNWSLEARADGQYVVRREPGLAFDLGGIAKGWMADRALERLGAYELVLVDAAGDMAIAVANGRQWEVGIHDPGSPGQTRYLWRLGSPAGTRRRWGLGVSGTTERAWAAEGPVRYPLIDPRTSRPAWTDLAEVAVLGSDSLRSDILAKAAIIGGRRDGLGLLERAGIEGAVAVTERGRLIVLPGSGGVTSA